jgi:hypothetical protein
MAKANTSGDAANFFDAVNPFLRCAYSPSCATSENYHVQSPGLKQSLYPYDYRTDMQHRKKYQKV